MRNRMPAATIAAEDEWWLYSHIPKDSDLRYSKPGRVCSGINVANPMGAFMDAAEIEAEDGRLNADGRFDGAESTTDPKFRFI